MLSGNVSRKSSHRSSSGRQKDASISLSFSFSLSLSLLIVDSPPPVCLFVQCSGEPFSALWSCSVRACSRAQGITRISCVNASRRGTWQQRSALIIKLWAPAYCAVTSLSWLPSTAELCEERLCNSPAKWPFIEIIAIIIIIRTCYYDEASRAALWCCGNDCMVWKWVTGSFPYTPNQCRRQSFFMRLLVTKTVNIN